MKHTDPQTSQFNLFNLSLDSEAMRDPVSFQRADQETVELHFCLWWFGFSKMLAILLYKKGYNCNERHMQNKTYSSMK